MEGGAERGEERKRVDSFAAALFGREIVVVVVVFVTVAMAVAVAAKTAAFLLAAATALVLPVGCEGSMGAQGLQLMIAMGVVWSFGGSLAGEWMMSVKPEGLSSSSSCCGDERRSWERGISSGCLAWLRAKAVLIRV